MRPDDLKPTLAILGDGAGELELEEREGEGLWRGPETARELVARRRAAGEGPKQPHVALLRRLGRSG